MKITTVITFDQGEPESALAEAARKLAAEAKHDAREDRALVDARHLGEPGTPSPSWWLPLDSAAMVTKEISSSS